MFLQDMRAEFNTGKLMYLAEWNYVLQYRNSLIYFMEIQETMYYSTMDPLIFGYEKEETTGLNI